MRREIHGQHLDPPSSRDHLRPSARVPVIFLHRADQVINDYIHMPDSAWVVVASGLVYLIARGHALATDFMNRLFDRNSSAPGAISPTVGETIQNPATSKRSSTSWSTTDANAAPGVGGFLSSRTACSPISAPDRTRTTRFAQQQPSPAPARFDRKPYTPVRSTPPRLPADYKKP